MCVSSAEKLSPARLRAGISGSATGSCVAASSSRVAVVESWLMVTAR